MLIVYHYSSCVTSIIRFNLCKIFLTFEKLNNKIINQWLDFYNDSIHSPNPFIFKHQRNAVHAHPGVVDTNREGLVPADGSEPFCESLILGEALAGEPGDRPP